MNEKSDLFDAVSKLFKKIKDDKDGDVWEFDIPAAYEEVRRRAYLKWEAAGKPEGRNEDFWFEAEYEVSQKAKEIDEIWFTDP